MKVTIIRVNMFEKNSNDAMKPLIFPILDSLTPEGIELEFFDDRIEKLPTEINSDIIVFSAETFSIKRTYMLSQKYKKDDVLVSNIRPYFKKIWQAKYDGGCSNDVLVFVPDSNIDKDFLYYVLADDDFFTYSMATSKGTKMPRGDKVSIMQYEVPLFDLHTQKKIASILKSLDEKIELNNKINNNLAA